MPLPSAMPQLDWPAMPDHHGCENLQYSWRHVQLLAGLRGQRAPQQQAGMAYCTRQCIEPGAAEMLGGVPARWRTAFQAISCSGTESVSRAMKTDTTAEGPAFGRHQEAVYTCNTAVMLCRHTTLQVWSPLRLQQRQLPVGSRCARLSSRRTT
jgi:hypothetical protein